MFRICFLFLLLFLTWIALSGFFEPFFVISGVVSCIAALFISHRLGVLSCEVYAPFYHPRLVVYLLWLIKEMVKSSTDVAIRMWQAEPGISPRFAWVPIAQAGDVGRTLLANSITLTPGTVAVVVEENRMFVHALCSEGINGLLQGNMDRKVAKIVRV